MSGVDELAHLRRLHESDHKYIGELIADRDEWRTLARELAGDTCTCYWQWAGDPPIERRVVRRVVCAACRIREKEERDANR